MALNTNNLATILQSAVLRTRVRHRPSPTIFSLPGLTGKPVHDNKDFAWTPQLESSLPTILKEYQTLRNHKLKSDYSTTEEHKLHSGNWDWNSYMLKGKRQTEFAVHCPNTVELLETIDSPSLMSGTPFSFAFFSTLHKESSIAAHFGPCNLRLRCHFPLIVPAGDCGMRVGDTVVKWSEGKPLIFDDCYEHEVWNKTKEGRALLLFDIWHPDLYEDEIMAIKDMFLEAQQKGWLSS